MRKIKVGEVDKEHTTVIHVCVHTQKGAEEEKELERKASLDSERQAVAVYQGHF